MPKALIVEDEPEANKLLAMLVQLRGYRSESAYTGGEALAMAGQDRPDIVFLDLMLPDTTGFDVCRALRSSRRTGSVPVVMVTARLAADNRVEGFRAGAAEYVAKPYTPDQIFSAIGRADAWRRRVDEGDLEGSIPLDAGADVAHLLDLSRLRGLVLGRTGLPEPAIAEVDAALLDLAERAVAWGRRTGDGLAATLHYRLDPDGVTLTLQDHSNWFAADSPRDPAGLGAAIARARFDEVACSEPPGQVVMVRTATAGG